MSRALHLNYPRPEVTISEDEQHRIYLLARNSYGKHGDIRKVLRVLQENLQAHGLLEGDDIEHLFAGRTRCTRTPYRYNVETPDNPNQLVKRDMVGYYFPLFIFESFLEFIDKQAQATLVWDNTLAWLARLLIGEAVRKTVPVRSSNSLFLSVLQYWRYAPDFFKFHSTQLRRLSRLFNYTEFGVVQYGSDGTMWMVVDGSDEFKHDVALRARFSNYTIGVYRYAAYCQYNFFDLLGNISGIGEPSNSNSNAVNISKITQEVEVYLRQRKLQLLLP